MGLEIEIAGKYLVLMSVFTVAVVAAGALIVSAQQDSFQFHTWQAIELPAGVWTGLVAEKVPWAGVTDKPIIITGFCEYARFFPLPNAHSCGTTCSLGPFWGGAGCSIKPAHMIDPVGDAYCLDPAETPAPAILCKCRDPNSKEWTFSSGEFDGSGFRHDFLICYQEG